MVPSARNTRNQLKTESSSEKASPATSEPPKRALNVQSVVLGDRLFQPSCSSNYPEDLVSYGAVKRLYICERCFKYSVDVTLMLAHKRFCDFNNAVNPIPGRIIYEEKDYQIWEVDGEEEHLFTQNLSLFAKLFIESKMVCFDIQGFLYYLLVAKSPDTIDPPSIKNDSPNKSKTRSAKAKPQIVGYYSKEKLSWDNHNLACILVFPPWQRLGLGQLLMKVSYEMGRREGRLGGPEKPLSKVGAMSYHAYWSRTLARTLLALPGYSKNKSPKKISMKDLSEETFIALDDITETLQKMGVVGEARKKDGCLKMDRDVVREWCNERGLAHARDYLDGDFFEYEDGQDSEDEDDDEANVQMEDDE